MKKILFLIPYPPNEAPSQRFRFEQYLEILSNHGYSLNLKPFLTEKGWKRLYKPNQQLAKLIDVITGFCKRWLLMLSVPEYEFVFIHREAAPLGPPIFEWIVAKIFRKKIIYDFDDAIWLTDQKTETVVFRILKWRRKVRLICSWAHKVSCGNQYLADFARKSNVNSFLIPTTIDTEHHTREKISVNKKSTGLSIGWTGSHSTLKYLQMIVPALQELENRYPLLTVHVIADKKPLLDLKSYNFHPWSKETEIDDLALLDIGLMPLPDDEWSKGKCGFKALQYMALGIPAIVSPVGVNTSIITQGENGFLASTISEWINCIDSLIKNPELRFQMGRNGRNNVIKNYSVASNTSAFLRLFE